MQKVSWGGRRSPLGHLGPQEALEGENIETLQQPTENRRSWPRVALSGAIKERDINEKPFGLHHFCMNVNVLEHLGGSLGGLLGSVLEAS